MAAGGGAAYLAGVVMGNRPTHRPHARNSCGLCKPGKRERQPRGMGHNRPDLALARAHDREREQRQALADVQAGRVQDHVGDYRFEPVTLTRGVW